MSATIKKFKTGEFLFKENEPSKAIYIIQKGSVEIRKQKGTSYVEIGKVQVHEVLGELAFFDRQPRSASAVALTEVDALEITFESLDKLYKQIPDYFRSMMKSVVERLRRADEKLKRLEAGTLTGAPVPDSQKAKKI